MRSRAFTLLEIVIYMVLAAASLAIITALFVLIRRTSEATYSNYLVSRDTETGIGWLRRDLQNASLASLRVYPNPDNAGERPGLSFACSLDKADPARPQINQYGFPAWSSYVFYTLEPDGKTANLVRWTTPYPADQLLPVASPTMPSAVSDTTEKRGLLHSMLLPNQTVQGGGPAGVTDAKGGFRVQFVRRAGGEGGAESLSDVNPSTITLDDPGQIVANTRLVEVELRLLHRSTTGKPSVYAIKFRVCPRY